MHVSKNGKTLYCICAMVSRTVRRGRTVRRLTPTQKNYYLHADNRRDAKLSWLKAFPNRLTHQFIEVGPAVGFFVDGQDKSGEVVRDIVSAD